MKAPTVRPAGIPQDHHHDRAWPTIYMQGVPVDAVSEAQCVEHVMTSLAEQRGGWIITPNVDHLRRAHNDTSFRQMVTEADMTVADGMPLIWASRLQGTPLPERVAGSSLVSTIAAAAARQRRSIFLLGGAPGTAEQAAHVLTQRYPGLHIAGTCCPQVGFDQDEQQIEQIRVALKRARPDIVYVALGSPKQERLIRLLRHDFPETWWIGVGISLSFLCGHVRRAPRWMQTAGLEWLHRLAQEPHRLARRYLVEGLPFALRLLGSAALQRLWLITHPHPHPHPHRLGGGR